MCVDPIFLVHISSIWVEISLHTEFQLPWLPGSGKNLVKLESSLAQAEAEVGAVTNKFILQAISNKSIRTRIGTDCDGLLLGHYTSLYHIYNKLHYTPLCVYLFVNFLLFLA